ncbi:CoA hydratase/isomerase [Naegleria gruberi]|uniref:Probable enoyl-CoA hydratase, mitochondrial n=1 Tax=Naegleria gruberi TaxID=5762 RepID=D2V1H4_NAEGR|nr:CoA hydratase/isomerase [Naegleria gruberi]EFC49165.1 CoA hydratase/isomerase [Naegleria gruberi]|eukprot:XP_002681909.1 CoA hydratase/isomerase [Naegleria gruberi strain NEG-M]
MESEKAFFKDSGVAIITLNRPKALNALCKQLVQELGQVVSLCEKDPSVRVMIITGSQKAFAAGADIKEMSTMTAMQVYNENLFGELDAVSKARKPVIAAVNGFALGGGCELAMMCDFIVAGENAKFGQPEIKLGTIPGIGGTQRLTKAIGKAKAMEWNLTGDLHDAVEAEKAGLVSRIVKTEQLLEETLKIAEKIASYSQPIAALAKECVNKAHETGLQEGLVFERRVFMSTFASKDQKEGMSAFAEKRTPKFVDE